MPLFQTLEQVSITNPNAEKILASSMRTLRNKLVFHFDVDEFGRQLKQMDPDEPIFIESMGTTNSQVHYLLGDNCAWQTLHEASSNDPSTNISPTLEQLTEDISTLVIDFTNAAEDFINHYLKEEDQIAIHRRTPGILTVRLAVAAAPYLDFEMWASPEG
jgi:hypothetical protein